jgi:GNAT superfamily N-acetyltransferase
LLFAPEPLGPQHRVTGFECGDASLDRWLVRRAAANHVAGGSRTFVACEDRQVIGYYALAAAALVAPAATGRLRRNMPDPVPVVLLGRLAVSLSHQGKGLGRALFRDAALRAINASQAIGIRGLVVHAISEQAKAFYLGLGLEESPLHPMTLMATLGDLRSALGETRA